MFLIDGVAGIDDKVGETRLKSHVFFDIAILGKVALDYVFGVFGGEELEEEGLLVF
jgi:hypothetical protein